MLRSSLLALLLSIRTACALLSPYARPPVLQPLRLASDATAALMQAILRAGGRPIPQLGVDIEVRSVGELGDGLFALRPFAPGELVARYSGVVSSREEFGSAFLTGRTSGSYVVTSQTGKVVDAEDIGASSAFVGLGHLINHSLRRRNCEVCDIALVNSIPAGVMHVQTTKAVQAGEQLFLDYGSGYWDDRLGSSRLSLQRLKVDWY